MRLYRREQQAWVCGHWNGSPLDAGINDRMFAVLTGEDDEDGASA